MSNILKLKKWLTIQDAARRLAITFGEDVSEADVLRLGTCGAHCRTTGEPCKNRPMIDKTRCRMHGGKGGRPKTTGQYTNVARAATNKRGEFARMIHEITTQLRDMER